MLRAVTATLLAIALSACWMSEKRLFGPSDFVVPEGLSGDYVSEDAMGTLKATVVLSIAEGNLVKGVSTPVDEDANGEISYIGFVPISGGSGRYYLMVDRSPERTEGDLYFIGRVTDDHGLEVYWPQCEGTPDLAGMVREKAELLNEDVCGFISREGVMRAALAAERVLSSKQMFEMQPVGRLKRSDESDPADGSYEETDGSGDFTDGDPFFE